MGASWRGSDSARQCVVRVGEAIMLSIMAWRDDNGWQGLSFGACGRNEICLTKDDLAKVTPLRPEVFLWTVPDHPRLEPTPSRRPGWRTWPALSCGEQLRNVQGQSLSIAQQSVAYLP